MNVERYYLVLLLLYSWLLFGFCLAFVSGQTATLHADKGGVDTVTYMHNAHCTIVIRGSSA